jgi:membrane protein implicated in regulation of membrane protease activity
MSLLLFGSVGFWLVVTLAIILLVVSIEKGFGTVATVTFVVAIALLFFFGNKVPIVKEREEKENQTKQDRILGRRHY